MTIHLEAPTGILCQTAAIHPQTTGEIGRVTCRRCERHFVLYSRVGNEMWQDAEIERAEREAVHGTGLADAYDFAANLDGATGRMLASIIGSLAIGLRDLGYEQSPRARAS